MLKRSLKSQLSLTIAMVVLVTVALISVLSNVLINQKFRDYIAEQQKQKTKEIVSSLSQQLNQKTNEWNTDFIHVIGMNALYDGYIIKVFGDEGQSIWDAELHDMNLCTQVMADISQRMQEKYPRINGEFTTSDYPLDQDGKNIGTVTISYYGPYFLSENDFQFLSALNTILISVGFISLVCSLIVAWFMARKISRPITRTIAFAEEISEGNYDICFDENVRTRELDALITSIINLAHALDEQEGLRKKLTADVAHELRTPLTTVGTHLEAMMEGIWEPTEDRLASCHEEIIRITSLVKDLGSLAKVEGDNLNLKPVPLDLPEIVQTIRTNFDTEIYRKNLTLTMEGNSSKILADRDRMSQVILNLLSNAVKYTPESGHIKVILQDTESSVILQVKDDGIGISQDELPYVFERFYRTDKSRNRKTGGAGIGLAIVKSIVVAHGGRVVATSETGAGSCFSVILPKMTK